MQNKKKLASLALLGLAQGLVLQSNIQADESSNSLKELALPSKTFMAKGSCGAHGCPTKEREANPYGNDKSSSERKQQLAKSSCGGPNGCSGFVADRDTHKNTSKEREANPYGNDKSSSERRQQLAKSRCSSPNGCSGLVAERDVSPQSGSATKPKNVYNYDPDTFDPDQYSLEENLMTEEELLDELNDDTIKTYQSLSPEGKALAREVASQACSRMNSCKGLNACATEKNSCAGKGSCKGQSKCGFSDKNLAVKVAAEKMKAKREEALKGGRQ